MNKLPIETRAQILQMLCEGSSMRSISRVADVSLNTVTKLLVDAGLACSAFHDATVRNVSSQRVQCDEIWSFAYAKQKNVPSAKAAPIGSGDVWTWTAIDADTKLILSWLVGDRDAHAANMFIDDLKGRLANRVQLTTDGHRPYLVAISNAFGPDGIDYGILQKLYGKEPEGQKRYSPAKLIGVDRDLVLGSPDIKHVSTSFVERQNLTMRMSMRRFTRLTNAFSKKVENHYHALALYFVWYNFIKQHKTLRMTPAMAAGLVSSPMEMADIVTLIDKREGAPKKRGPYKKRLEGANLS
ncbi:IS1 family transposase [Bradyrhizobium japonicum]|jgi:IS1 family transposase|uniref:DDE-type integrase/transposase/recombinase n=1 Tax=Bradyrhizobium TaxID=374 RepID=UPI00036A5FD1|nr:DDE-type integrase/transposase/recombinase [Bradyrhizobium elkanii]MCP1735944.1 IS1 family transposase [Bradyrhizobium elkanii]MCS3571285.1 IS1 family transposase [Bradyrhizobium elkanii]MCS3587232.1 IS1 family transposase [Bradyrhizobium elkanii]MCS3625466.1 IS1 family transposase [Bradyrhizobium elkanii]MCS3687480.1 IS1 family transposase [Bradyrhizobium elkanii]